MDIKARSWRIRQAIHFSALVLTAIANHACLSSVMCMALSVAPLRGMPQPGAKHVRPNEPSW